MLRKGLVLFLLLFGCETPPQVKSVRERSVQATVELLGSRAWSPGTAPLLEPPKMPPFEPIDSGVTNRMFRTLDHEEAPRREGAMQRLQELGRGVVPVLLELRKKASPEQAWRVDKILNAAWPCPELFEDAEWGKPGRWLDSLRAVLEKVDVSKVEEEEAVGLGLRFGEPEPVLNRFIQERGLRNRIPQELELVLYYMTRWARDLDYGGAAALLALKICELLALRQEERFLPYFSVLSNTPWMELTVRIRWSGFVSEGPSTYSSAISGQARLVCVAIEKARSKWRKSVVSTFIPMVLPTRMPAPGAMVRLAIHGDPDKMFPIIRAAYESNNIPKTAGLDVLAVMIRITRPTDSSRKFWANRVRDMTVDRFPRGTGENRWESIRPKWWAALYIGAGLLKSKHPEIAPLLGDLANTRRESPISHMNDVVFRRVKGGAAEGPKVLSPEATAAVFSAIVLSGGSVNDWERTILANVLNQWAVFEPKLKFLPFHTTLFERAEKLGKNRSPQKP